MSIKNALPSSLKLLLEKGAAQYQSGISVDCVILGFHEQQLKILLLKIDTVNKWALPGGFIKKTEHQNYYIYFYFTFFSKNL